MGAASAVMHAARDPSLAGLVLDSPFASLEAVAVELVTSSSAAAPNLPSIPPFLVKTALRLIASSVKSRAGFDLYKLRPVDFAPTCFTAALFATAIGGRARRADREPAKQRGRAGARRGNEDGERPAIERQRRRRDGAIVVEKFGAVGMQPEAEAAARRARDRFAVAAREHVRAVRRAHDFAVAVPAEEHTRVLRPKRAVEAVWRCG